MLLKKSLLQCGKSFDAVKHLWSFEGGSAATEISAEFGADDEPEESDS
ncbi:hypothetical protein SAMN04487972_1337 [Paracoccus halophilus]|uniref:Uncharacterized protein n=1 Tax=Paracoccus halophilus TaxID=376733 RepID=A0A1I0UAM2_9RHOB|nr:hypothetical protein SAMN04487972_1337 [Paracoccus halophilus]